MVDRNGWMTLAAALAVLGCGSSSSSTAGRCSAEPIAASGPGDASHLFPLGPADSWIYQVTTQPGAYGPPDGYTRRVRRWVAGTRRVGTRDAVVVRDTDPDDLSAAVSESLLYLAPGGLVSLGESSFLPGIQEVIGARFPVSPGPALEVATCTRVNLGLDVDGDGRADTFDVHATVQVLAFEDVAVPAGRFPGAARIDTRIEVTAYASSGGQVTVASTETDWYAPLVGLVRASIDDGLGTVMELAGYEVGGASAGVGPPMQPFAEPGCLDSCPALAAGGGRILALVRNGCSAPPPLRAVTLSPEGGTLSDLIALDGLRGAAAAAFDGTRFLVAAAEAPGADILAGRRLDAAGAPLDPSAGFPIAAAADLGGGTLGGVAAAGAAGEFLVVFVQSTTTVYQAIWGVRVSGDGAVSAPRLLHEGESVGYPAVAAGPGGWLVAWAESSFAWTPVLGNDPALRALRLGPDGAPLDTAPIEVAAPGPPVIRPRIASDGTGWLLAWQGIRDHQDPFFATPYWDAVGARLDADGALRDGPASARGFSIAGSNDGSRLAPAIAHAGGRYLAAFQLDSPSDPIDGIRAVGLGPEARPDLPATGLGLDVGGGPAGHTLDCPAIVLPDGGRAVVVWRDQSGSGPALRTARLGW